MKLYTNKQLEKFAFSELKKEYTKKFHPKYSDCYQLSKKGAKNV